MYCLNTTCLCPPGYHRNGFKATGAIRHFRVWYMCEHNYRGRK